MLAQGWSSTLQGNAIKRTWIKIFLSLLPYFFSLVILLVSQTQMKQSTLEQRFIIQVRTDVEAGFKANHKKCHLCVTDIPVMVSNSRPVPPTEKKKKKTCQCKLTTIQNLLHSSGKWLKTEHKHQRADSRVKFADKLARGWHLSVIKASSDLSRCIHWFPPPHSHNLKLDWGS